VVHGLPGSGTNENRAGRFAVTRPSERWGVRQDKLI
jgi:hypothetical protein